MHAPECREPVAAAVLGGSCAPRMDAVGSCSWCRASCCPSARHTTKLQQALEHCSHASNRSGTSWLLLAATHAGGCSGVPAAHTEYALPCSAEQEELFATQHSRKDGKEGDAGDAANHDAGNLAARQPIVIFTAGRRRRGRAARQNRRLQLSLQVQQYTLGHVIHGVAGWCGYCRQLSAVQVQGSPCPGADGLTPVGINPMLLASCALFVLSRRQGRLTLRLSGLVSAENWVALTVPAPRPATLCASPVWATSPTFCAACRGAQPTQ